MTFSGFIMIIIIIIIIIIIMIIIMHRCKLQRVYQKMCVHYGAGSGTTAGEGEDIGAL